MQSLKTFSWKHNVWESRAKEEQWGVHCVSIFVIFQQGVKRGAELTKKYLSQYLFSSTGNAVMQRTRCRN